MSTILNENNYEIRKIRDRMRQPKKIIISQCRNFYEKETHLEPSVMMGSSKYTFGTWQFYFYKILQKWRMPMHYFIEQLANDFVGFIAHPEYSRSYFIEDLVENNIIDQSYLDSIVICIAENYTIEQSSKRLYEQLAIKLLVPIQLRYSKYIDFNTDVKYIDEIINWENYFKAVESGKIKYDITPSKYYAENVMKMYYHKFRSSIGLNDSNIGMQPNES